MSIDDTFFFGEGNKLTVDGQGGLYALSKAEWSYLINSRGSGLYKCGVTVTDGGTSYTNCLIIAPDDYSGTALSSITDWSLSNINSLGLVCLPAAGLRSSSTLQNVGLIGCYRSSTPYENSIKSAYRLSFDGSSVNPANSSVRKYGNTVRLVSTVSD